MDERTHMAKSESETGQYDPICDTQNNAIGLTDDEDEVTCGDCKKILLGEQPSPDSKYYCPIHKEFFRAVCFKCKLVVK